MKKNFLKRYSVVTYDILSVPIARLLAFWIRSNLSLTHLPPYLKIDRFTLLIIVIPLQLLSFWLFGLYRGQWRFASIPDMIRIVKAVIVGVVMMVVALYFFAAQFSEYSQMPPRSILPLYALFLIFLLGGARLLFRWFREYWGMHKAAQRVLIVGAGLAGESLVRDLHRDELKRYFPVGFVDDQPLKKGTEILGVRVLGNISKITTFVKQLRVDLVLIAIPSADAKSMRAIVEHCRKTGVEYRTLPSLSALASGAITVNDLRPVSLEDLLGREAINLHDPALLAAYHGKRILVTGGGGSIGSELCRQLAQLKLAELIILESSEYNNYAITLELSQQQPTLKLTTYLQDITQVDAVARIMQRHQPQIVFHAAAYKHVPLLESQPAVAVKNNIIGTQVVAQLAVDQGVEKFILVSTDKAVNPSNVMGCTKRIAEIFCQNLNEQTSKTRFITVRFGNVLGSAGSVVPLFQKQLAAGGPMTVTHPEITRYFMMIPEASQLILHAAVIGHGGEIYVLDMGEPIKIVDLAAQMVSLAGKKLGEDIDLIYTGLRPGEKLYEELFHENENLNETGHAKILKAQARIVNWQQLGKAITELNTAANEDNQAMLLALLNEWVPENKMGN